MHKMTIAALAMAISFGAQAEWTKVTESTDGNTHYLDFATIKKTQHGYRVWVMQDYQTKGKNGDLSAAGLQEFDCKDERSRVLQVRYFYGHIGEGGISSSEDDLTQWSYPMPGSIAETLLKAVCRAGK